jgi:dipeptidase E
MCEKFGVRRTRWMRRHIAILSRMRLYLSSYRLGDQPHQLPAMLVAPGPAAVIGNALDAVTVDDRERAVDFEITALAGIGIDAEELDLRDYFRQPRQCADRLARYRMVWLRGGNVFVLRYALARSGADTALAHLVVSNEVVYAGYSAGCCVLAPSLRGLELIDAPNATRQAYGAPPRWDGLGLLPYAIVPHHRSAHPESDAAELVARRYRAEGVPHRTIRDGHAIVITS